MTPQRGCIHMSEAYLRDIGRLLSVPRLQISKAEFLKIKIKSVLTNRFELSTSKETH